MQVLVGSCTQYRGAETETESTRIKTSGACRKAPEQCHGAILMHNDVIFEKKVKLVGAQITEQVKQDRDNDFMLECNEHNHIAGS